MSSRRFFRIMVGIISLKLIVGLIVLPIFGLRDFFPFSTYALFSRLYTKTEFFTIEIEEVDGKVFQPPQSAHQYFKDRPIDFIMFYEKLEIVRFKFQKEGDFDRQRLKEWLSGLFKENSNVRFSLMEYSVDTIAFYQEGGVKKKTRIESFHVQK